MVASARVVAGVQTASFLSKTFFFAHAGDEMSSLACRACSLCRAPVVHPELYPEFERTLNKRVQKGHKDGCKEDAARRCKSAEKEALRWQDRHTHENSKSWRFYLTKHNVPSRQPLRQVFNLSAVFWR